MPFRRDHSCAILIPVLWAVFLVAVTGALAQNVPKQVNTEKNEAQLKKEIEQLLTEAEALYREKRYEEAILLQQRSLALTEKSLGPEHSEVGDVLFIMGVTFQQMGAFAKALPVFQRCLAIKEKTVGMENDKVATILVGVGLMQKEQGNYAQAVAAFTRSLAIVEKIYGKESSRVAATLNSFSSVLFAQGDYAEALRLLQRSLSIREQVFGPEHPDVATCLNNLGELYRVQGNYLQASNSLRRSLEIRLKVFGPINGDAATTLNNFAMLEREIGNRSAALEMTLRALDMREKIFGSTHPDVALSLNNLGSLYQEEALYAKALNAYRRSLAIAERIHGPEHASIATTLNNIASVYGEQGIYDREGELLRRSLSIRERTFGLEHPEVANSLNNLALMNQNQGHYGQALALLHRSLAIEERCYGPDHPSVATTLNNIGSVCESQGDYGKAVHAYHRSLAILEKAFGPNHQEVANILNNLAGLYSAQGKLEEALATQNRSLAVTERIFGSEHPKVATALGNLSGLHLRMGNRETALQLCTRSLEITEKVFGPDHPQAAVSLALLAGLQRGLGNDAEALRLYRRSVQISQKTMKTLGSEHPESILWSTTLAVTCQREGNSIEAQRLFSEVVRSQRNYRAGQLATLPLSIALRQSEELLLLTSLHHSACAEDMERGLANAEICGAESLSLSKSLIEEAQAVQTALESAPATTTWELRDEYETTRLQLEGLAESHLEPAQRDSRRRELPVELTQLETKLAERVGLVAQTIRERNLMLADIARRLPHQSALLDFIEYRRFDFVAKTNEWKEQRYAVYVTFPLADDATNVVVERFDLGEAAPVNEAVELICKRMASGQYRAKDLSSALQRLSDLVYTPLAAHLTNVSHLIVCPDGQLSRVPFEMLRDGDKSLVEEKTISYVTSGREVARIAPESKTAGTVASPALVMGDPDFDLDLGSARVPRAVADASSGRSTGSSRGEEAPSSKSEIANRQSKIDPSLLTSAATRSLSFRSLKFKRLHGTADEARTSAQLLGVECKLRLGAQARERELKAVLSPRVLHLATHGFFLSDQEFKPTSSVPDLSIADTRSARRSFVAPENRWENPMVRCGIALAGANHAQQITNAAAEDGLLTGLEASLLNLQGTELVILSACDTGSGEVKIGEGVMSLRRAFRIAGAESVLASHWKVSDKATGRLMTEFMRRWRSGEPRAKAWREAQLSLLHSKDFPNPYFWAAFTLTGQWK